MRYRYLGRLIGTVIVLLVYFFFTYPIPAIVTSVVLIGGYLFFTNLNRKQTIERGQAIRRRAALDTAKIYLSPYKDIWHNLKLSNKYCTLRLGADGYTIRATEKSTDGTSYRTFKVVSSNVHSIPDLWDMFCISFGHNTTYDSLVEDCQLYKVVIKEQTIGTPSQERPTKNIAAVSSKSIKPIEKTDINNASEIELTALPGISIVMAKKIIKKREEIGGFKNINDFFLFLKLKPHMETQLREIVYAKKMKGSLKIKRYNERSVDL